MPANLLSMGCQGFAVTRIQQALNLRMLPPANVMSDPALDPLVPDGNFGSRTDRMVREFQRLNRIDVDGIVGPVTRLHLFPFVRFNSVLRARGAFRAGRPVQAFQPQRARSALFALQPVGDGPPKDGPDEPDKPQGLRFELFIGAGIETRLKDPWPPRFGAAEQTLTLGAVLLRSGRLEISGELEASKHLSPKREGPLQRQESWDWGGSLKASYEAVAPVGPVSPLSPFVQIAPLARLPGSVGIEAKIDVLKDVLELSVDLQGGVGYDTDKGKVIGGAAISGALQFNLDILFRQHPPATP